MFAFTISIKLQIQTVVTAYFSSEQLLLFAFAGKYDPKVNTHVISPFVPVVPGGPSGPVSPSSPGTPGSPDGPAGPDPPLLPLGPAGPGEPGSPSLAKKYGHIIKISNGHTLYLNDILTPGLLNC